MNGFIETENDYWQKVANSLITVLEFLALREFFKGLEVSSAPKMLGNIDENVSPKHLENISLSLIRRTLSKIKRDYLELRLKRVTI